MDDAGETEFDELVRGRSSAHLRTAYLLTGDWASAEDLLQTTFAKVYVAWRRITDRGEVDAYVRRTMINTYCSWWRRAWRGERPTADLPDRAAPDEIAAADQRDRIRRALAQLPRRQRAAVVLRHYDDLSEAETARVLGCSVGTVKSQTARGLARMRELLAELPDHSAVPYPPALVGAGQKGPRS